jgi:peptidoglycan-associated lipoprotein
MSASRINGFATGLRAVLLGGMLVFLAACATSGPASIMAGPGSRDDLLDQAGGATDDPAAGFENVQPGSEEDFILTAGRRTYFTEGSAELDSTARVTLDNQIVFLRKYPNWYAKLQGFADDPGGDAQMVALSQRRADAVMNYLVANGIDAGRLWSKGYGKERVVRECSDRSCKVQNRRVITQLRTDREAGV